MNETIIILINVSKTIFDDSQINNIKKTKLEWSRTQYFLIR